MTPITLSNVKVPASLLPSSARGSVDEEGLARCDVAIGAQGSIASVSETGSSNDAPGTLFHAGGRLLFPGFVDVHTHLDKTHTWRRAPNPTGKFWDAIRVLGADSARWTPEDLERRAQLGLESAYAHGTRAIRTHLDTSAEVGPNAHGVIGKLRAAWAGRIEIQTVSLCGLDTIERDGARIQSITAAYKADALGGFPQPNPNLDRQLDRLIAIARELRIGLDLHVDESGLAHAECLRATAEAVLRNEFEYPVACGHCCSLAVQDPERASETLELVSAAGISIISLPLCNVYLQDRRDDAPRTPRWRGVTLLQEALDLGITCASASDNVRDAFHAHGDYDLLEVLRETIRIAHLDTPPGPAAALVTRAPADIMGLGHLGRIEPGADGQLVLSEARSFSELLSRPWLPRRRLVAGSLRHLTPPPLGDLS
jgi:cytosine/creatinine deaminase